jgi:hypothetical protein
MAHSRALNEERFQSLTTLGFLLPLQDLTLVDSINVLKDDLAVMGPDDPAAPEEAPVSNPTPSPVARPPHTDLPPVEYIAQQTPNQKLLKWYLLGGIGGGGLLLIIIIMIACCCICALDKRERLSNSVKISKTVKKESADDPAKPVPPTVAAAIAAAALNPSAQASAAPQPATLSTSQAAPSSTASVSAPPRATSSSNAPNANIALAALGSVRMKQSPIVAPVAVKLDSSSSSKPSSSSSSSSSYSGDSSSSEEESSEEDQESSESSSESRTYSASEPRSAPEELSRLNYDLGHVDDQGFDEW